MHNSTDLLFRGHVVVIAGNYPAPGHERHVFVQQLVHAMIDRGICITVLAPQSIVHSWVYKERLLPNVSLGITPQGNSYTIYRPYIITMGNYHFLSGILNWWNRRIINKMLKKLSPEVLYAHFWSSALYVNLYASHYKIPLFVACGEGDNAIEEMVKTMSSRELEKLTSAVTGVISVSSVNKRKCIKYHLAEDDMIGVFPNCVDTNLFRQLDKRQCRLRLNLPLDDFIIVFVGGFIPRKGGEKLAHAISLIEDSTIKVMFIGKPFPGYSFDFDCPGIIHKGPVEHNKLPLFLNAADIFVLPTQNEGCSNAIVEALSVGIPVVSSDRAFNDDILDEENSIRVDPNDVQAIREAILRLKNNPQLYFKMREVSNRRHSLYSVERRAQRIISFIQNHLSTNVEQ